jgi:hypothetical protein
VADVPAVSALFEDGASFPFCQDMAKLLLNFLLFFFIFFIFHILIGYAKCICIPKPLQKGLHYWTGSLVSQADHTTNDQLMRDQPCEPF